MRDNVFFLEPVSPFRLDLTVWTVRRRPENVVERWDDGARHYTDPRQRAALPAGNLFADGNSHEDQEHAFHSKSSTRTIRTNC
jgi:hypothetical protein